MKFLYECLVKNKENHYVTVYVFGVIVDNNYLFGKKRRINDIGIILVYFSSFIDDRFFYVYSPPTGGTCSQKKLLKRVVLVTETAVCVFPRGGRVGVAGG